jgi:hypothetical protein
MNPDPDYSAAYVVIGTDSGVAGHGLGFTIGRGNDIQAAAIQALEPYVVGRPLEATLADMGELSRWMVHDPPLRWLGPEEGLVHMAIGAVINAMWDLGPFLHRCDRATRRKRPPHNAYDAPVRTQIPADLERLSQAAAASPAA